MNTLRLAAALAVLVTLAACSKPAIQRSLAIPACLLRSEDAQTQRIHLPVPADESRTRLKEFLEFGVNFGCPGERRPVGKPGKVAVTAQSSYGKLLAKLSDSSAAFTADDLLTKATFSEWFKEPPIRTVVDARDVKPPQDNNPDLRPYAANDGTYWWIFYPDKDNKLTGLTVVKAPEPDQKRQAN